MGTSDRDALITAAAVELSRTTAMSFETASRALSSMSTRGPVASTVWIDEARWDAAVTQPDTVPVESFMTDHHLTLPDMRELLREYRSETGYAPFEFGTRDVLASDFLNWHRWERL